MSQSHISKSEFQNPLFAQQTFTGRRTAGWNEPSVSMGLLAKFLSITNSVDPKNCGVSESMGYDNNGL